MNRATELLADKVADSEKDAQHLRKLIGKKIVDLQSTHFKVEKIGFGETFANTLLAHIEKLCQRK